MLNSLAMDVFGGYSNLLKEDGEHAVHAGRNFHEYLSTARIRFGGGTNDIQRRIIATRGLGLPRG